MIRQISIENEKFEMFKVVCLNDFHFEREFDCVYSWKLKFNMNFCYIAKLDPVRVRGLNVQSDWNCTRFGFNVSQILLLKNLNDFCKWNPFKLKFIDIKVFLFSTFTSFSIHKSQKIWKFTLQLLYLNVQNKRLGDFFILLPFTVQFALSIYSYYFSYPINLKTVNRN